MTTHLPPARKRRRDYRLTAVFAIVASVAVFGYLFSMVPSRGVAIDRTPGLQLEASPFAGLGGATPGSAGERTEADEKPVATITPPAAFAQVPAPARELLESAHKLIEAGNFDDAISGLTVQRETLQPYGATYLLLGNALEGKKEFEAARDFYFAAIERDPYLADAHFGFATTSEALGDLEGALGGMRSYLHTEPDLDPERLKVSQARSAIWEWEAKLGRGPWGPTRGIPPGFTAEEVKRDGRGVGLKMPIPGTEQPDGTMQYEIKAQDKFQMFRP